NIRNLAPTADALVTSTGFELDPIMFTGIYTEPNPNDFLTYRWHVSSPTGMTFPDFDGPDYSFMPPMKGHYTVTQTVSDGTDTVKKTYEFDVANAAPRDLDVMYSGLVEGQPAT